MDKMKQQMEGMHQMCLQQFNELRILMEYYLQGSDRIQKMLNTRSVAGCDNSMYAFVAFDRYMTRLGAVVTMARKFNISLQLNALDKTVLDPREVYGSFTMDTHKAIQYDFHPQLFHYLKELTASNVHPDIGNKSRFGSRNLDEEDEISSGRRVSESSVIGKPVGAVTLELPAVDSDSNVNPDIGNKSRIGSRNLDGEDEISSGRKVSESSVIEKPVGAATLELSAMNSDSNVNPDIGNKSRIGSRNLDGEDEISSGRKVSESSVIENPVGAATLELSAMNSNSNANPDIGNKSRIGSRNLDGEDEISTLELPDMDSFLRSILPVKDISDFTEGRIFSGYITYVKDCNKLEFFICEMKDYCMLHEISNTLELTPLNQAQLAHTIFAVSPEEDSSQGKPCIWRAVGIPQKLCGAPYSVLLVDFGEILQVTKDIQIYNILPMYREYPPMAIKCVLKGVCGLDDIVTNDHGKCKDALLSNELKISKFRVLYQESSVLHLVMLSGTKIYNPTRMSDLKMTLTSNPFLGPILPEDIAELTTNKELLHFPSSGEFGNTSRIGLNTNIKIKVGDQIEVLVTHVNSPISFYGIVCAKQEALQEVLSWSSEELEPSQMLHTQPMLNDIVLAQYSKDEQWYRAKVIEMLSFENQYKIFYIDFGNTELVTLDALALCKDDAMERPPQAVPLHLANLKMIPEINASEENTKNQKYKQALEFVVVIILNQTIDVEVVDRDNQKLTVQLLDDIYSHIPSLLVEMGVVERT